MTVGSLFSGIGGLELGLEMAGPFHTLWQAEQDEFARRVLAKHWPDARRFHDVRHITAATVPGVDVLCGGFPCQPHSLAGKRLSSADERDLWGEFARIVGETRPRWVVAENVPGLLSSADPAHGRARGGFFGRVLRDLAGLGFDAEWHSLPAAAVGAPHLRYRIFLVAYANSPERWAQSKGRDEPHGDDPRWSEAAGGSPARGADARGWTVADTEHGGREGGQPEGRNWAAADACREGARSLADTDRDRQQQQEGGKPDQWRRSVDRRQEPGALADADGSRRRAAQPELRAGEPDPAGAGQALAHAPERGCGTAALPEQPEHGAPAGQREGQSGGIRSGAGLLADPDRQSLAVGPSLRGHTEPELPAAERSGALPDWAGGTAGQPWPLTEYTAAGEIERDFHGVPHGVSLRVDRLGRLGNAVVPQVAQIVGRAILAAEAHYARHGVMPAQIVRPEHVRGEA